MSHSTIDRLQRGLYECLDGVATDVTWSGGEHPRGTGSLLTLSVESCNETPLSRFSVLPAEALEITIGAVVAGALVALALNGFTVRYTVPTGGTSASVRDALVPIVAAIEPGIDADPIGSSSIALFAAEPSARIWQIAASGAATVDEGSILITHDAVEVRKSRELYEVAIQAYSRSREPRHSAHAIMSEARKRLRATASVTALGLWGVSPWAVADTIDLSAIAGAHWESRARCAAQFSIRSYSVEPVDVIETATTALTATVLWPMTEET